MPDFYLRAVAIIAVVIYFIFGFFDAKRVKDEREELIQLKSTQLMHKLTLAALSACAVWVFINPAVNATAPLLLIIVASMFGEIGGKIFYRRKF